MRQNQIISMLLLFFVSFIFSLFIVFIRLAAYALDIGGVMFGTFLFVGMFSLLVPVTIIITIIFELLIQAFKLAQLSIVTTIVVALSFTLLAIFYPIYLFPYIW